MKQYKSINCSNLNILALFVKNVLVKESKMEGSVAETAFLVTGASAVKLIKKIKMSDQSL